jgi:predicted nucleotidyltransferase
MTRVRSSELPAGESLERALATVLASSLAEGSGGPLSDVDVAVLGSDTSTFDERADRGFFCRDPAAADAWEDFALRRYLETTYLRRLVYQHVRDDLADAPR